MLKLASRTSIEVDPHLLGGMTVSMLRGEDGFQLKEIRKLSAWLRRRSAARHRHPAQFAADRAGSAGARSGETAGVLHPSGRGAVPCAIAGALPHAVARVDSRQDPSRRRVRGGQPLFRRLLDARVGHSRKQDARGPAGHQPGGVPCRGSCAAPVLSSWLPGARGTGEGASPVGGELTCACAARPNFDGAALEVAGYLAPEHRGYLRGVERQMKDAGFGHEFHYRGELDRAHKIEFLSSLDVLCVPSTYDEPKGISVLEAMASGVAVVQPRRGAFPEILEKTGGGILVEPDDAGQPRRRLSTAFGRLPSKSRSWGGAARRVFGNTTTCRRWPSGRLTRIRRSLRRQPMLEIFRSPSNIRRRAGR